MRRWHSPSASWRPPCTRRYPPPRRALSGRRRGSWSGRPRPCRPAGRFLRQDFLSENCPLNAKCQAQNDWSSRLLLFFRKPNLVVYFVFITKTAFSASEVLHFPDYRAKTNISISDLVKSSILCLEADRLLFGFWYLIISLTCSSQYNCHYPEIRTLIRIRTVIGGK